MKSGEPGAFIVGFFIGAVMFSVTIGALKTAVWQREIVNRGYALYCPLDGKWAWNGECVK